MAKKEKTIRQPLTSGVAKVPVVMQMEALECGAASLAMILAYYEKWIPLEQVRSDCGVSRDGSKAKNILRAARSYGLEAKGYRFEPDELEKNGKFPCIIHWNFNHFVVLNGFRGEKAVINDPAKGTYSVSMDAFDKSFTGVCMMFEPSESFENGTKTVEVKIVDSNGNVLKNASGDEIKDTESVTVKGGFFQKIISFFKNLFGMNRIVVQTIFKDTF